MILNPNESGPSNNRVAPINSEKLVLCSRIVNRIPKANKNILQQVGNRSFCNNGTSLFLFHDFNFSGCVSFIRSLSGILPPHHFGLPSKFSKMRTPSSLIQSKEYYYKIVDLDKLICCLESVMY